MQIQMPRGEAARTKPRISSKAMRVSFGVPLGRRTGALTVALTEPRAGVTAATVSTPSDCAPFKA